MTFVQALRTSPAAIPLRKGRDTLRAAGLRLGIPRASDAMLEPVRLRSGQARPRVSVVIPTVGRETLQFAIDSASRAYEVIVVYDAAEVPADAPAGVVIYATGPTRHWGAEQRCLGISRATGTHIAFIDDDDVYARNAGNAIIRALSARPSRVHVFKMRNGDRTYGGHGCVWDGGIGTPMFVVPNDSRLGEWTTRRAGDFDFIQSTLAGHRRRPRYHEDVVAEIRPESRDDRS